jgi:hypothetical protein
MSARNKKPQFKKIQQLLNDNTFSNLDNLFISVFERTYKDPTVWDNFEKKITRNRFDSVYLSAEFNNTVNFKKYYFENYNHEIIGDYFRRDDYDTTLKEFVSTNRDMAANHIETEFWSYRHRVRDNTIGILIGLFFNSFAGIIYHSFDVTHMSAWRNFDNSITYSDIFNDVLPPDWRENSTIKQYWSIYKEQIRSSYTFDNIRQYIESDVTAQTIDNSLNLFLTQVKNICTQYLILIFSRYLKLPLTTSTPVNI